MHKPKHSGTRSKPLQAGKLRLSPLFSARRSEKLACLRAEEFPNFMRFWGGRGRKFKSCHSDQTQKDPASLMLTGFLLYMHKCRHSRRSNLFSASTQMGVDVQSRFYIAVAEVFLHFFRIHAAVIKYACGAVT